MFSSSRRSDRSYLMPSGLVGIALVALTASLPAVALPEAKVMEKIKNVPVYLVADAQGNPIEATSQKDKTQGPVVGVFATRQDAKNFIDKTLRIQQPDLVKSIQVRQVSLADIYQYQKAAKSKPQVANYVYVPTTKQTTDALSILQQQGKKMSNFAGMPLFAATTTTQGRESYVSVKRNGKDVVPLFFGLENLQMTMARLYPGQSSKYKIKVLELNETIGYAISTNDRSAELFEFNPMPDN
jgi:Tic22-like family